MRILSFSNCLDWDIICCLTWILLDCSILEGLLLWWHAINLKWYSYSDNALKVPLWHSTLCSNYCNCWNWNTIFFWYVCTTNLVVMCILELPFSLSNGLYWVTIYPWWRMIKVVCWPYRDILLWVFIYFPWATYRFDVYFGSSINWSWITMTNMICCWCAEIVFEVFTCFLMRNFNFSDCWYWCILCLLSHTTDSINNSWDRILWKSALCSLVMILSGANCLSRITFSPGTRSSNLKYCFYLKILWMEFIPSWKVIPTYTAHL